MQRTHCRARVDTQVVGERGLQPLVGVKRIRLTFGQVIGGDQLRPQRLAVGVFDRQRFEFTDDGIATPASDFGLRARRVRHHFVLGQRRRERVDELKFAQVLQNRSAPFRQRGRQMVAGLLETSRRGGLHARGLREDESADVAAGVVDREPITRWRVGQHRPRVAKQPAQVRDVGVQAGPRFRRRPLFPRRGDQRVDSDRPVAVHHQHRQHGALFRGAQRHRRAVDRHQQRPQHAEPDLVHPGNCHPPAPVVV